MTIANLLGLEMAGEISCAGTMQPAYSNCTCGDEPCQDYACLEVVPFYHQDVDFAIEALEQICNERGLVPRLLRTLFGKWIVALNDTGPYHDKEIVRVENKSLPLAICKALAKLGE